MDRVIMLCNCSLTTGECFRKGWYYALPTGMAESLVVDHKAYWEGEEPPLDRETLRQKNHQVDAAEERRLSWLKAVAHGEQRRQALIAQREEAARVVEENRQKLIRAQAAAKRGATENGKDSNHNHTASRVPRGVNTNKNSRRRSKRSHD